MSEYTTGEIAKLCGVSVRTVQYYDARGVLMPSNLTEGGRRLYSDEDVGKMKIICFLRELDLPLNSIKEIMHEEKSQELISLLLSEQERVLKDEIKQKQAKLSKLEQLQEILKKLKHFSVESIGDVAHIMKSKKELRKVRISMLVAGIIMDIIEIGTLILWIMRGIWWPFAIGMCIVLVIGIWISRFYFKRVDYICPKCHTIFKPSFKQAFFARNTPYTRKLICTACGYHGFCVETCGKEDEKNG